MSYVRSKMINGYGPYYYLVKSERVGGKSRQIHIAYLGKNAKQHSGTATKESLGIGGSSSPNEVPKHSEAAEAHDGKDKSELYSRNEIQVGKPSTSTRKMEKGTEGKVKTEVRQPSLSSEKFQKLKNTERTHATVEADVDFKTGAKPKKKAKVWKVYGEKNTEFVAGNLTYDEAVEKAKDYVESG
ncbi:MAG: hypothetical protein PHT77_10180, partial [Bacteroidales bacterium]|nr:hypothetical protein [Bacteroidales bacterium]